MIQHLALPADWAAAQRSGRYDVSTRGASIAEVGFLHASRDDAQTRGVAERFYADVLDGLLVLEIDEAALAAHGLRVVVEAPDPAMPADDPAMLFPHVYGGSLPVAAVSAVRPYGA